MVENKIIALDKEITALNNAYSSLLERARNHDFVSYSSFLLSDITRRRDRITKLIKEIETDFLQIFTDEKY